MLQLYQDIMNIQNVNSTNFQARFRFANTKPKPPTIKDVLCERTTRPCKKVLSCGANGIAGIWLLGSIITKIMQIKNSIKKPT